MKKKAIFAHTIPFYCMRIVVCLLFACLALPAFAQKYILDSEADTLPIIIQPRPKPVRFLELGVSANSYKGDLSGYEKWTACYHGAIRFNEAKRLNSRIGFGYGFVTGDNRAYKFPAGKPNIFFRSSIFFLSYEAHYNFIKTPSFMLYASAGLGICNYQPKNELGEKLVDLLETRDLDEAYGRTGFMIPIGSGATYLLKNGYGVGVHASWLNVQTDYLDNISVWGTRTGNDNVLSVRFYVYAPLQLIMPKLVMPTPRKKRFYTHELE